MGKSTPNDSTPPELRAWMDAEFKIEGLTSSADLPNLHTAVNDAPGVESVSFFEDGLAVRYDPEQITEVEIRDLIGRAGFRVTESKNAPIAPRIESAEGEQAAPADAGPVGAGGEDASGDRSKPAT